MASSSTPTPTASRASPRTPLPPFPPRRTCATPSAPSPNNSPPPPSSCFRNKANSSLDDPVGKYIPGLTRGNEVTIRQILSHTSGYQDYWPEDYVMTPMLQPDNRAAHPRHLGQKAARLRARHAVAVLQHQLRHRRPHRRNRLRRAALRLPHRAHLPPARHDLRLELRRKPAQPPPTPRPTIATRSARCAPRPKKGRLDVRRRRARHDRARPRALGRKPDCPVAPQSESYKTMFTEVKLKNGDGTHYGLGVEVRDRDGHRSIEHSRRSLRLRL